MKVIQNTATNKYYDGNTFVYPITEECIMEEEFAESTITSLIRDGYSVEQIDCELYELTDGSIVIVWNDNSTTSILDGRCYRYDGAQFYYLDQYGDDLFTVKVK